MSNAYVKSVIRGVQGKNKGLPGGLPKLDKLIGNVQRGKIISIVGNSGSGKTYLTIYRHIISPIEAGVENIKIFFWSLEMSEQDLIGRIVSYYMYKEYGIKLGIEEQFSYGDYQLSEDLETKIKIVYKKYVLKILSKLEIITDRSSSNPTGIRNILMSYAEKNGRNIYEKYNTKDEHGNEVTREKIVKYIPNDPDHTVVCIIDHLGLMKTERGFGKKQNIDKWMEDYAITLSTIYNYIIVNTSQLNRTISSVERQKFNKTDLEPQTSDIKETSSIEESSDMIISLFNPNTFTSCKEHKGYIINQWRGYYRGIKVIKSRYTLYPISVALFFDPKACRFIELPPADDLQKIQAFRTKYFI